MAELDCEDRVEVVYRAVHPRLWRALVAYTADRDIASDAEAEAFAQALRRGDHIVDVAAWVWRTAFAIATAMLADRARERPLGSLAERASEPLDSSAEFADLLRPLSGQQRACVVLRYVGGMDASEIAVALNTTATTVRVQLHRARATLRRTVKEGIERG
jgi:RNA polymerase sigma-70 factor (ECF subfamily)